MSKPRTKTAIHILIVTGKKEEFAICNTREARAAHQLAVTGEVTLLLPPIQWAFQHHRAVAKETVSELLGEGYRLVNLVAFAKDWELAA